MLTINVDNVTETCTFIIDLAKWWVAQMNQSKLNVLIICLITRAACLLFEGCHDMPSRGRTLVPIPKFVDNIRNKKRLKKGKNQCDL